MFQREGQLLRERLPSDLLLSLFCEHVVRLVLLLRSLSRVP